jgi:predicted DNA-binding transcriptional regulator AlpA
MQTFMTHNNYVETAQSLDDKRLGKQRVEAYQILKALRGDYDNTGAWVNHPATVMWRGNEYELALYGLTISVEWYERGFEDSMQDKFTEFMIEHKSKNTESYPWWVTNDLLLTTHQSNLMRKDSSYYAFDVPANIPYVWPLPDSESFRLGSFKNGDNLDMLKGNNVYLTSKQIAELLGISPKTISAYKARGQMPKPDKEYGRTPLWSYDTIEKWRGEIHTPVVPIK